MEAYGEQSYYSREEDNDSITSRDRCSHSLLQGLSTRGIHHRQPDGVCPPSQNSVTVK